jgi:hypothetical protein
MTEFLKEQAGFILAIVGGLIVSILSSEKHTFTVAAARICAGLFCSTFLSDPFMHWMDFPTDTYRNAVAGLFAMMGYAVTKFVVNIDRRTLIELIKVIRGGK